MNGFVDRFVYLDKASACWSVNVGPCVCVCVCVYVHVGGGGEEGDSTVADIGSILRNFTVMNPDLKLNWARELGMNVDTVAGLLWCTYV